LIDGRGSAPKEIQIIVIPRWHEEGEEKVKRRKDLTMRFHEIETVIDMNIDMTAAHRGDSLLTKRLYDVR
jgi:hypothetical protein